MCPQLSFDAFCTTFSISSYVFFAVAGAIFGAAIAYPLLRRIGLRTGSALGLLLLMAVSFLAGARLLNFIINQGGYKNGMSLTSLRFTGFSLYGGITGAFAALLIWAAALRKSPWAMLDALVAPSAAAIFFARIGCFMNGCCSGKATGSFLGVVFPAKKSAQALVGLISPLFPIKEIAVYPTQLFEAGAALLGLIPSLWLYFAKKYAPGTSFFIYGIWFSAMRLAILPFRVLPYPDIVVRLFYPLLYAAIIITGIVFIVRLNRKSGVKTDA